MRLVSAGLALACALLTGAALAANPVNVEITAVDEQSGTFAAAVSVVGADGRPLTGLTIANFRALLNDTPITVTEVKSGASSQTQTSILLLVDVSGSMQGAFIDQSRRAMQDFVAGVEPSTNIAVMSFDSRVTLVQDFTTDRNAITQAINKLVPLGDTALYDAVLEGVRKTSEAPPGRKMIVLLSDGQATTGLDKRNPSIAAAQASGISVVAIGLGTQLDKPYLNELTAASGGRFLDAPTTAVLRQAYVDLAQTIRSQYTLALKLPPNVDRTVATKLTVQVSVRADNGADDFSLTPLAGAVPPPFELRINGLIPGQRLSAAVNLDPTATGQTLASVEYSLDGQVIHSATAAPFAFALDPAALAAGSHTLKVTAKDQRGGSGEAQLPFLIAAPAGGSSSVLPLAVLLIFLGALTAGGGVWLIVHRKPKPLEIYAGRIKPWSGLAMPRSPENEAMIPPVAAEDRVLGQVVVMDERAIKAGNLDAIREYEIRTTPLTLGSGPLSDIQLEDMVDEIAMEEARLWVQKGRLVYHKLTTLSAMATEGVTSGWVVLSSGDELRLGHYRILFRERLPEPEAAQESETSARTHVQEHGMGLHGLWTRASDDPGLRPSAD